MDIVAKIHHSRANWTSMEVTVKWFNQNEENIEMANAIVDKAKELGYDGEVYVKQVQYTSLDKT